MQQLYGLLGHPLEHSLSPPLHAMLCTLTGYPMEYTVFDTAPQDLPARLPHLLTLEGFNITLPYKQEVIPHMASLSESAARYHAVNTVVRTKAGCVGHNTDCVGFLRALGDAGNAVSSVFIIGVGGVGRMFAVEMARRGASVTLGVRPSSLERALQLAREWSQRYGVPVRAGLLEQLSRTDALYDLLINASPCGMYPHADVSPAGRALVERCGTVFDCIYNPASTELLTLAAACGKRVIGGLRMLVWQGAAAHEIWYGARLREPDILQIEERLSRLL